MASRLVASISRLFRRRAAVAATIAIIALANLPAQALAQSAPPAPVRQYTDPVGVDLFTGKFTVSGPMLVMGSGDNSLSYQQWNAGEGWSDNLTVYLNQVGSVMTVSLGSASDTFSVSGTTYTSALGNGSTLTFNSTTNVYTYTRSDGTVAHFNGARYNQYMPFSNKGMVSDIVSPNGDKLTFDYQSIEYCKLVDPFDPNECGVMANAYRLASVISNYGYRLVPLRTSYTWTYDPFEPGVKPDWAQWTAITGIEGNNLATSVSTTIAWQNFATTTVGSDTFYSITDAESRQTKYRMGSAGEVVAITLPGYSSEGIVIYNSSGLVTSVQTPDGTTSYTRSDSAGERTVTVTDALGHATVYKFDIASHFLKSVTIPVATGVTRQTSYQADSFNRVQRITYPENNYTQFTYDARGNVTEQLAVSKTPGTPANISVTAGYDTSCGNPVKCNKPNWTKDAKGNQTDYTYDATHGGVLTVTAPADGNGVRPQVRYTYASKSAYYYQSGTIQAGPSVYRVTSVSSCKNSSTCANQAEERKQTFDYGPQTTGTGNNLNLVGTTIAAGDNTISSTTTLTYDTVGNVTAVDGPLSGTTDKAVAYYNNVRQLTAQIGPDPDDSGSALFPATRLTYNSAGFPYLLEQGTVTSQSSTLPGFTLLSSSTSTFDWAGRTASQTLKGSDNVGYAMSQQKYDAVGRADCTAVRMIPSTFGTAADACVQSVSPPSATAPDRITKFHYDWAGRLTRQESGYGTGAVGDDVAITYTQNGQRETLTDGEGNTTTYLYDGLDRLYKTEFPDLMVGAGTSSSSDYEEVGYDANGNVTSFRTRRNDTIGLTYDNLNRLIVKDIPDTSSLDVYFKYDLFGNLTDARFGSVTGEGVTNVYDARSRVTSSSLSMDSTTRQLTYQYDVAGNQTKLTYPGSVDLNYHYTSSGAFAYADTNSGAQLFSVARNQAGQVATLSRWNPGAGWGTPTTFGYNVAQQLSSLTQNLASTANDVTTTFAYNPAGQIAEQTRNNDAYAFTVLDNADVDYVRNGLNQYTSPASANGPGSYSSICYDANGNLIGDATSVYRYDVENRLTERRVRIQEDCATLDYTGTQLATLRYDPLGRLYQTYGSTTQTLRYLYDGSDLVAEYTDGGTLLYQYMHGPGVDQPLVMFEGSSINDSARRYLFSDERGSVVAVTDASGSKLNINSYDEYGIPSDSNAGRFQYTGQIWLSEMSAYYYKARMYAPRFGRFMQTDPIGYGSGMNLYSYVRADPLNLTDPSGLTYDPATGMFTCPDGSLHQFTGQVGPLPCPGYSYGGTSEWCANLNDLLTVFRCEQPNSSADLCTMFGRCGDWFNPRIVPGDRGFGGGDQGGGGNPAAPTPQNDEACSGPRVTYSYGVGGTAAFILGGTAGASINFGVPTHWDWRDPLKGFQVSLSGQVGVMAGYGGFVGGGTQHSVGISSGPATTGVSSSYFAEFDAGVGESIGGSAQINKDGSGASGAIGGRVGLGAGIYAGAGEMATGTYAFQPIGC